MQRRILRRTWRQPRAGRSAGCHAEGGAGCCAGPSAGRCGGGTAGRAGGCTGGRVAGCTDGRIGGRGDRRSPALCAVRNDGGSEGRSFSGRSTEPPILRPPGVGCLLWRALLRQRRSARTARIGYRPCEDSSAHERLRPTPTTAHSADAKNQDRRGAQRPDLPTLVPKKRTEYLFTGSHRV